MSEYDYQKELEEWKLLSHNRIEISFLHVPTNVNFVLTGGSVSPCYTDAYKHGLNTHIDTLVYTEIYRQFYRLVKTQAFMMLAIKKSLKQKQATNASEETVEINSTQEEQNIDTEEEPIKKNVKRSRARKDD